MPLVNPHSWIQKAHAEGFAIGGFNANNFEQLQAIVKAAELEPHEPSFAQAAAMLYETLEQWEARRGELRRQLLEMLGLDPLTVANEGRLVAVVPEGDADRGLAALREHPLGRDAAAIGVVKEQRDGTVELETEVGGVRIVVRPYGEELPRIC